MNENLTSVSCPSDPRDLLSEPRVSTTCETYGLRPTTGWTLVPVDATYRARNLRSARLGAVCVHQYLHGLDPQRLTAGAAVDVLGAVTDAVLAYVPVDALECAAEDAAACCDEDVWALEWLMDSAVGLTTALELSEVLTDRERPEAVEQVRAANLRLRGLLDRLGAERLAAAVLRVAAEVIPAARLVRELQGADGLRGVEGTYDPMDYWSPVS